MNIFFRYIRSWFPLPSIGICLFLLTIFQGCKEETIVTTVDVTPISFFVEGINVINSEQIKLEVTIQYLNDEEIVDYGFSFKKSGYNHQEQLISLGKSPSIGLLTYDYKPKEKLELGLYYEYYFYIKTNRGYYKSYTNSFSYSGLKTIVETLPYSSGETVTLSGDFSMLDESYKVQILDINARQLPIKLNDGRTTLSFTLPANYTAHNKYIQAVLVHYESSRFFSQNLVRIKLLGKVSPPVRKSYYYYESLVFTGINNNEIYNHDGSLRLIIGDQVVPYRSEIKISDIGDFEGSSFRIGYVNGRDSVIFPDPVTILLPPAEMLQLRQRKAHPFSQLHLVQRDMMFNYFINAGMPILKIGPYDALYYDDNQGNPISFRIGDIPNGNYQIGLSHRLGEIESPYSLEVEEFDWHVLPNQKLHYGDKITFKGTFIDGVEYGIQPLEMPHYRMGAIASNNEITVEIPFILGGRTSWKIGYNIGGNQTRYADKIQIIDVLPITFDGVSPLRGTTGEIITLTGKGIKHAQRYYIGDREIIPYAISADEVRFAIPFNIPRGTTRLSILSNNELIISPVYLEIF
ncbi:hypothetical protein FAZ19_07355 [Sphingobacterium alkalisoli]|uniref:IPT/TIG domain-containing protein n=1 Tax=Sphingobacterium alkalisoli TaxID=1874115 RepID=A0A4U0H531_9SPHI|nr:hypothetical protein [Sphingobacterium alkalisoli]TJY66728.1 hypothetical protein FAZ19_07355 [Sphingobacterium alkalisoli]